MPNSNSIPEMQQRHAMRLPPELQLNVLRYVYEPNHPYLVYQTDYNPEPDPLKSVRERLKPIRLMGRVFNDAVTPIVFASIHLHASELSLQRAESIANSPLARHVREIVHHEGTFAGARDDKKSFSFKLKSHRRRLDYPKDYHPANDDNLYLNYVQEIEAGRGYNIFQTDRMTVLLQKLPRCVTITSLPYDTDFCDPMTSAYTLRRTGLSYLPIQRLLDDGIDPSFLSSIIHWSPLVLNLANFPSLSQWRLMYLLSEFPSHDKSTARTWTERLTHLRLNWPEIRGPTSRSYSQLLAHFLGEARSLIHLEITHGFDLCSITDILPSDGLPNLTHLTISKGNSSNQWIVSQIYNFIKALGHTLTHLHFDNVTLLTHSAASDLGNEGSLLALLFNLTACTNLESCTGLETVTDTKTKKHCREAFVLPGPKTGKAVILDKVQEAVCHKRSWPGSFSIEALPLSLTARQWTASDTKILAGLTREAAFSFSAYEDTVDPWDMEWNLNATEDDEYVFKQIGEPMKQLGLGPSDDEVSVMAVNDQPGPSTQNTASSSAGIKTKRNRISKILGLKRA